MTQTPPVFCAIDRPDLEGALGLGRSLLDVVGGLKVGLEFATANGPDGIRRIGALGLPVFLDLKFHDIPNTVAGAVRAAASLGVAMLSLHVAGGLAMLRAAVEAAHLAEPCPKLLGVTVLTSLDDADLAELGVAHTVTDQVLRLAELAWTAGLDGVICSPHEILPLRERFGREFKLVAPGIRPRACAQRDQKRTLAPAEALAAGADVLVIGRPITDAADPRAAAAAIGAEIQALQAA
jgi:orotidine-5'-phosphate decarboxylase